ncbi:MAG TPA: glycosyltransferase family 4 protein [Candidatus Polarisedimenticolia bacterium]|nr:glycosyltransferase family 4 protein [Candidatus Polarisedimenticolia bacterium]
MRSRMPGRVHVCHIVTLLELGGAQQNTLYTVGHLDRSRYRVSLVAGKGGLLDAEALALPDVEVHLLPELVREVDPASDLKALGRLTALLLRLQPDVVHTHSSKAGVLGRWAAYLAGVGTVIHSIHGFGFHPEMPLLQRGFYRALEAGTSAVTTRFLAVSQASLDAGVSQGILTPERSTLVRSGIRLAAFRRAVPDGALRRDLSIAAEAPLVGMIACLKPQKAPLDFVRAAQRVASRVPTAHFLLAGDGEQRGAVEEAARAAGLSGRLHLLGWRRDIPALLSELSLLVLTSLWEGLPRVVPEAMAAGLPVVATRVDGTPEAVRDGETGFLVDPHDVQAMAEKIEYLLTHPAEARRMGERGRLQVEEFDIDAMVERQEAIYESLLSRQV